MGFCSGVNGKTAQQVRGMGFREALWVASVEGSPNPQRIGGSSSSNCSETLLGPRGSEMVPSSCLMLFTTRVYLCIARIHKNTKKC